MGQSLMDDIISTADSFVNNFSDRGVFDHSIESLALVEQLLEEIRDFDLGDEDTLFNITSMVGCYVFETARRNYGGEYQWWEKWNQPVLVAGLPDFSVAITAWDKVKRRLINGEADSIPFYISGYQEHIEKGKKEKGYHVTII